jgi:hypothetical protein
MVHILFNTGGGQRARTRAQSPAAQAGNAAAQNREGFTAPTRPNRRGPRG